MLSKDMRRGERRWRGYCKWMRRLKGDWATHGRKSYPRPLYGWENGKTCVIGFVDSLCDCFQLDHKQAFRFKDTPTLDFSKRRSNSWEKRPPKYASDERRLPVERESYGASSRKKNGRARSLIRAFKVQCRQCGFLIEIVRMENDWRAFWAYTEKFYNRGYPVCSGCKERNKAR